MDYFSTNIRFLRIQNSLKQSDMLDKVGITRTTWSSYENEVSQPDIDGILKIADFFNVSVEALLTTDIQKENAGDPLPQSVWAQRKNKQVKKEKDAASGNLLSELEQIKVQIQENQRQITASLHTIITLLQKQPS